MLVEISPAIPLTLAEKNVFTPDLIQRGLTPKLLDIISNIPERTNIIKVKSDEGQLIGLSSVILTPAVFMKHCYGQGNHIGTNNTVFFAPNANRAEILAAIFLKLLEMRPTGHYVGFFDDEFLPYFKTALSRVPHVIASKIMTAGSIATRDAAKVDALLKQHHHLSRQIHRFRNKGGVVHVHEGPVEIGLAEQFVACCLDSYQKNVHPGMPINIEKYTEHVRNFITTFPECVHIYATLAGRVMGVQTFIRHARHLELTEGGFFSETFHAYENIMLESVRFAIANGLDYVSYGLILNPNKDRLMDVSTRKEVYLVMFFRENLNSEARQQIQQHAHERFPMLLWKDRDDTRGAGI